MNDIFKQRFENFEPEVSEDLTQKIFEKVGVKPVTTKPLWLKTVLGLSAAALVAIFSWLILEADGTPPINNDILVLADTINKNEKNNNLEALSIAQKENKNLIQQERSEELAETHSLDKTKKVQADKYVQNKAEKTLSENIEPKESNDSKEDKPALKDSDNHQEVDFHISAEQRKVCGSTCLLSLDKEVEGEWLADRNVRFVYLNSYQVKVEYSEQEVVLVTFKTKEKTDTFSVFFNQAMKNISFNISSNPCDNKCDIIFEVPENYYLKSYDYELVDNQINDLSAGIYDIQLYDDSECPHQVQVEVPQHQKRELDIEIDALKQEVGYPIYFNAEGITENMSVSWSFGDEDFSEDNKPEHIYSKSGNYLVQLKTKKENCPEQVIDTLIHIDASPCKLPNVFTPNNDGFNDCFIVRVPKGTHQFKAQIFNRSGSLVYSWTDKDYCWNGIDRNGNIVSQGTYFYIISGKDSQNEVFEYKHFLTINR